MNNSEQQKQGLMEREVTLTELAYCAGTSQVMIRRLCEHQLIEPCREQDEPCFQTDVLERVQRIIRLHRQLDVDLRSMDLVLDLLDRIDDLEHRLARQ